ncbi:MAG: dTMP kinase [Desulfurococcaceae archaeon]|nr:dTMP kinase [Desulfurococcaceae archaeon]MCC6057805.1 dTMP kinase [Desulfurococcaceae archaeon]
MYSSRKGSLIAIEGIDGAGKTTTAKILVEKLRELGFEAEYTYEPFSSPFSGALKKYIEEFGEVEPEIEALAMALDRLFHVKKVIEPLLKKGVIVITDRYVYSSIAYQGAKGADIDWIKIVNRYAVEADLVIYLRVPLEIALERMKRKESKWKYFEDINRLKKVLEIYESLVYQGLMIPIDASRSIDEVVNDCLNLILVKVIKPKI